MKTLALSISLYHPVGNGLAEQAVQIIKTGLRKTDGETLHMKLQRFLFSYRLTPQLTTGISGSQLRLGSLPRSKLGLIFLNIQGRVKMNQRKVFEDSTRRMRPFRISDPVWERHFSYCQQWIPGVIDSVMGPVSYVLQLQSCN